MDGASFNVSDGRTQRSGSHFWDTAYQNRVASSKPAVNLSVWMVSLPWNKNRNAKITDNIITRGWADPQNHESIWESKPLEPDTFYELEFDLQPDDQIIPKGQKIGLMIFSSDQEFTLWPDPGTELTVDLGATTLNLPVVGGQEAFKKALSEQPNSELEKDGVILRRS